MRGNQNGTLPYTSPDYLLAVSRVIPSSREQYQLTGRLDNAAAQQGNALAIECVAPSDGGAACGVAEVLDWLVSDGASSSVGHLEDGPASQEDPDPLNVDALSPPCKDIGRDEPLQSATDRI